MLALAIGKFDALHRGHRALIDQAAAMGEPALLGFTGMAAVLGWPERPPLIAPPDRQRILQSWRPGLRDMPLDFATIRPLSPQDFLARLAELGADAIVVGEDFRFGRDRAGSIRDLPVLCTGLGLRWAVVPVVRVDGVIVSSSGIRTALAAGNVATVARQLGRPYRLHGTVGRGEGRGRLLGFPTANCVALANQAPGSGVYAARAQVGGRSWPAAVNAGHVPTVSGNRPFTVEAHLLGFSGDCYGADIALDFIARLREERRFDSLDALKAQIASDVQAAERLLS
jgi:riboflavin kinase / FMN adenylyltransferase